MNNTTAKLTLAQVQEEFKNFKPGNGRSKKLENGVKDHLLTLAKAVQEARTAGRDGKPGSVMSLDEGVQHVFGTSVNDLCYALNFAPATDSVTDFLSKLGLNGASFGARDIAKMLEANSSFSTSGVGSIDPQYVFLISELLMRPIVIKHDNVAQYKNWSAQSYTVGKMSGVVPIYNFKDVKAETTTEGASGRRANVTIVEKPYRLYESKVVFTISDRLIRETPFNLMASVIQEAVGPALARYNDALALATLVKGDVIVGGSTYPEAAPVVGVETTGVLAFKDVTRLKKVMGDLGRTITHAGLSVEAAIGNLHFGATANPYLTVNGLFPTWAEITGPLPANQQLFLDAGVTMADLSYGGLTVKQEQNIETDDVKVVIRSNKGFLITNALGRVVIDTSVLLSANPYPETMNAAAAYGDPYLNWLK